MISRHARDSRRAVLVVAAALGAAAALAATPGGAATPTSVKVWFLQGEQLVALQRPGSTQQEAVQALLAGPTPAETRRGVCSYVPAGTPLRAVSVANGVATVDLGEKFVAGRDAQSLLARLSQVVAHGDGPGGSDEGAAPDQGRDPARAPESYGVALPRGSALSKRVDAVLGALLADGTIERLQRKWLTAHLDALPVLR